MWAICVHGGAGNIPDALVLAHRSGCARAVEAGAAVLASGGGALEAACASVRVLEDDPLYNAGVGAALDARGLPAQDAAVMRGTDLGYGAVGAVVGIKNPIDGARGVLEDGRHCLLVGAGAASFARARGLEMVSPEDQITPRTRRSFEERSTASWGGADVVAANPAGLEEVGNTVGAVVRDVRGQVAAATSTGGLLGRAPGRVGDTPIAGAGTYARDDLGAASATGHGETMMRTVLTFQALLDLAGHPEAEVEAVLSSTLDRASERVGGRGGIIAVRPDGQIGFARNTPRMGVAWRRAGEPTRTAF